MPATRKVQTQLLMDLPVRQRADALALVLDTPRAEVLRKAIEGSGLGGLEAIYHEQLKTIDPLAAKFKMTRLELAEQAMKRGFSLAALKAGHVTLNATPEG